MSDFGGFDAAAASAIETDLFDAQFEINDLDVDGLDVDGLDSHDVDGELPDPIDGADVADITFGGTEIPGGSAVNGVAGDDLIVASDGTAYAGYADFVFGTNTLDPLG